MTSDSINQDGTVVSIEEAQKKAGERLLAKVDRHLRAQGSSLDELVDEAVTASFKGFEPPANDD